ncbi:unnamed protein product [Parajaminaea phylloscopi]
MVSVTGRPTLFLVCLILAACSALPGADAQVTRSPSIDPLNGSTVGTPSFAPANTFTPDTTYASATGRVPTAIAGPGPSVTPASYTFSYGQPTATVPGTNLSKVYSSLAAHNTPTAATDALVPDASNLQIVNAPASSQGVSAANAANAANSAPSSVPAVSPILAALSAVGLGVMMVLL